MKRKCFRCKCQICQCQKRLAALGSQVFSDPGYFTSIILQLNPSDAIQAGGVCWSWREAVDNIFGTLTLDYLLRILGPFKLLDLGSAGKMHSLDVDVTQISTARLSILLSLASQTRRLDLGFMKKKIEVGTQSIKFAPHIFLDLLKLSSKHAEVDGIVFRRLKHLIISHDVFSILPCAFTPLFFPPSIQTLTIPNLGIVSLDTIFRFLSPVASNLTVLELCGTEIQDAETLEHYLIVTRLESLPSLRKVVIKRTVVGWHIIHALSSACPNMTDLMIEINGVHMEEYPSLSTVLYPKLERLEFSAAGQNDAIAIGKFIENCLFLQLQEFSLCSTATWSSAERVTVSLGDRCKETMQRLAINFSGDWSGFQSLTVFKKLQSLDITTRGPLKTRDVEFEEFCSAMPQLRILRLNASDSWLTPDALIHIADTSLLEVELPIQWTASTSRRSQKICSLSHLRLTVFGSALGDIAQLAEIVSSICSYSADVSFMAYPLPSPLVPAGDDSYGISSSTHGSHQRSPSPCIYDGTEISNLGAMDEGMSSYLQSTFRVLHNSKKERQEFELQAIRAEAELEVYLRTQRRLERELEIAQLERDAAIREQKTLEIMLGKAISDDSSSSRESLSGATAPSQVDTE